MFTHSIHLKAGWPDWAIFTDWVTFESSLWFEKRLSNPKSWPTFLPQQFIDIFMLINTFRIWFVVGISVFQKWFDEDVCLVFQIKFLSRYFGTFSRQLFWVFFIKVGHVFPNHLTPLNGAFILANFACDFALSLHVLLNKNYLFSLLNVKASAKSRAKLCQCKRTLIGYKP
jgi:hypothetical protein